MIEHVRAVDNLTEIPQVSGLDAIMIGPYDLSASMGLTAKFDSPEFIAAMECIRALCNQHRITCGVHVVQPDFSALEQRIAEGHRFIALLLDSVFFYYAAENPLRTSL